MDRLSLAERVAQAIDEVCASQIPLRDRSNHSSVGTPARKRDPAQLGVHFPSESPRSAGSIRMYGEDDVRELEERLRENRVHGLLGKVLRNWRLDELSGVLLHERQHGDAAIDLGAGGVEVGLQLGTIKAGNETWIVTKQGFATPRGVVMTWLAYAAFFAHPEAMGGPSYGDLELIASKTGLPPDVQQIGALVVAHNANPPEGEPLIPVPMTYRP